MNAFLQRELWIIAGANGSGKSTFAFEFLERKNNIIFINADEIAKKLNPENLEKVKVSAGKIAINLLNELIQQNKSILIETTLSGNFLQGFINKAKKQNYKIILIYLFIEHVDICLERIKIRVSKGGHHVPSIDVHRRYHRSKYNFWYKYKNIVNNWVIYYNGIDGYNLIAQGESDNIDIHDENLYKYFKQDIINE